MFLKGFIKSTDHLLTDHRPSYHQPLTHRPTDPPTHRPNNHRPKENFMFKRLENMSSFILQNVNTAGKIENYRSIIYLNRIFDCIQAFDWMNNIYSFEHS